ncbi:uncharacterized protein LOC135958945 isoform X3 [Calliphora vicina]|uniref:uncharacterized protein LOC135958945 isoform X3 n=1 Tax=Calliphora vicina TaxID=7373 RepID=UPI00325BE0E7
MKTLRQPSTTKNLSNLNRKCGDITYCIQVGKRVYALNCLYCPQICLQWDIFINHMEEEHNEDLNFALQHQSLETEPQIDNVQDEISEDLQRNKTTPTTFNKLEEPNRFPFNDPLEGDNSTNAMSLESSIKIEKIDCTPIQTMIDDDDFQYDKSEDDKNDEEFTVNMEQNSLYQNANFSMTDNQERQYKNSDFHNFRIEIKEDLQNTEMKLSKEIREQTKAIKSIVVRIIEEIKLNKNLRTTPKTSVIPKEPFTSIDDFLNFESEIQNDEKKYYQLVSDFEEQSANSLQNYVKSIWRKLIKDGAAQHMCWKGTERKTPVRSLTVTQALKAACVSKFTVEADLNFEKISIQHFQHAKGRHLKKLNYKNKTKTTI